MFCFFYCYFFPKPFYSMDTALFWLSISVGVDTKVLLLDCLKLSIFSNSIRWCVLRVGVESMFNLPSTYTSNF